MQQSLFLLLWHQIGEKKVMRESLVGVSSLHFFGSFGGY